MDMIKNVGRDVDILWKPKVKFLELFECKAKEGYEILCTYYLRCYGNIKTIFKIICLY